MKQDVKANRRELRRALGYFGKVLKDTSGPASFAAATDGDVVLVIAKGRTARLLHKSVLRWGGYGEDRA